MELLASLSKTENLKRIHLAGIDGIIFGSLFSLKNSFPVDVFLNIMKYCDETGLKKYVVIDSFISEEDKGDLYTYFDLLLRCKVDGIYFHDLAVYDVALSYDATELLIYDGQSVMTNSVDAAFFLNQGINGVVLGRELRLDEVADIISEHPNQLDMQIFGRFRMSYSKRKFLSNYFKEIGQERDVQNDRFLSLMEETRTYRMPVFENEYGTQIFTDFVFEMYKQWPVLGPYLKRAIIDDSFLPNELFFKAIHDYRRLTNENVEFMKNSLYNDYPQIGLSSGYFFEKVTLGKDDEKD